MVGPAEVDNVLVAHPAVAEADVVGKRDPMVGEIVTAVVSLYQVIAMNAELGATSSPLAGIA